MSEREQKIKVAAVEALKLWREARDSGWKKHAHTTELLDAVNMMSHAYDIEHEELTAAQSRVAELEAQNSNLAMLVQRLVRRARHFDASCRVAKQALDYLVRNNLMPSVLRGEIIDE